MKLKLSVEKILGNSLDGGWVQIHDFTPEDAVKFRKRGRLVALISFDKRIDRIELVREGREVLTRLHEEYFGEIDKSVFSTLKDSVEKVKKEFDEQSLEISCAALLEETLYTACCGGGEVSLFRNNSLVKILDSTGTTINASGFVKKGDVFSLATSNFEEVVGGNFIKETIGKIETLEKLKETFSTEVNKKNIRTIGCALLGFGEETSIGKIVVEDDGGIPKKEDKQPRLKGKKMTPMFIKSILEFLPERKIYIKKTETKLDDQGDKKRTLLVGILFIVILAVSTIFGIKRNRDIKYRASYEDKLIEATHYIKEAKEVKELSPNRSRELFDEARIIFEELSTFEIKDERFLALKEGLEEGREEILGLYKKDLELFLDLKLLRDNFSPNLTSASLEQLLIFDTKLGVGASVFYEDKKTELYSRKIDNVESVATFLNRYYVLNDKGIYDLSDGGLIIKKDWSGDAEIFSYAANIYLVEKENSKIIRYSAVSGGFSEGNDWLASDTSLDLDDTRRIVVDGMIWLLVGEKSIVKLSQGVRKAFFLDEVFPQILRIDDICTNEGLEEIYVLEKSRGRVVVFDKEGSYLSQYASDSLGQVVSISVSKDPLSIVALSDDGKLYSFSIEE